MGEAKRPSPLPPNYKFLLLDDHEECDKEIARLTAQRDEAWRFIAALAENGPLTVTERALADAPSLPEFVRWDDAATLTTRVRLVNGKGSYQHTSTEQLALSIEGTDNREGEA